MHSSLNVKKRTHNTNSTSNSVHFIGYLLTCRLNSKSAYYKASTKQTKQKQYDRKNAIYNKY